MPSDVGLLEPVGLEQVLTLARLVGPQQQNSEPVLFPEDEEGQHDNGLHLTPTAQIHNGAGKLF